MTDTRTADDVRDDSGVVDPDRAAPQLTEVEQLASEMGWKPDHQPKDGKPARTAQEWIRSTNANNRNLRKELNEVKGAVDRIASAADRQVKREVQARASEIEARFNAAVEDKDTEGAAKAANEMRELERESQPTSSNGNAVEQFQRDNGWYGTDPEATDYAVSVSNRLAREGVTDPVQQLAKVREAVLKRFPEHSPDAEREPKPQRHSPALGDPGSRTGSQPKAKSYGDMPDVAKAAADRFYEHAKTRGTAPDRKAFNEQYAKDYFAEQA